MGSLGLPEIAFIFILALLIFGPKRLPQIGRTIGKGMAEFRRASTELQRAVNTELEEPQTPAWRAQPAAASAPAPLISSALPAGTVATTAAAPEADAAQQPAEPAPASVEPAPEPITPTQLQ